MWFVIGDTTRMHFVLLFRPLMATGAKEPYNRHPRNDFALKPMLEP